MFGVTNTCTSERTCWWRKKNTYLSDWINSSTQFNSLQNGSISRRKWCFAGRRSHTECRILFKRRTSDHTTQKVACNRASDLSLPHRTEHQGLYLTTNEIRSNGHWIVSCSSAVFTFISTCVKCRKQRTHLRTKKLVTNLWIDLQGNYLLLTVEWAFFYLF